TLSDPHNSRRRQREIERRAVARLRLDPDFAAVAIDDLFAGGKADTRPGILIARVEALKDHEDAIEVLVGDPYSVVADIELPLSIFAAGAHVHRGGNRVAKFDRIADQVLEKLGQLNRIALNTWQGIVRYVGFVLLHHHSQIGDRILKGFFSLHRPEFFRAGADP